MQPFPDALDFNAITDIAIRPSTAANNSARFTVVGPPGSIPHAAPLTGTAEQIVDGGFRELRSHHRPGHLRPRPPRASRHEQDHLRADQLGCDAVAGPERRSGGPGAGGRLEWGSELRSPPSALLQTRSARGLQEVALTQSVIAQEFGGNFVHFALSQGCGNRAPLGWALSKYARESLNQAWSRPTCAQLRVQALMDAMKPVKPLAAAGNP